MNIWFDWNQLKLEFELVAWVSELQKIHGISFSEYKRFLIGCQLVLLGCSFCCRLECSGGHL